MDRHPVREFHEFHPVTEEEKGKLSYPNPFLRQLLTTSHLANLVRLGIFARCTRATIVLPLTPDTFTTTFPLLLRLLVVVQQMHVLQRRGGRHGGNLADTLDTDTVEIRGTDEGTIPDSDSVRHFDTSFPAFPTRTLTLVVTQTGRRRMCFHGVRRRTEFRELCLTRHLVVQVVHVVLNADAL